MEWLDIYLIAEALEEKYPGEDIENMSFPQLRSLILKLDDFSGDPKRSNEKILEAIQTAWLRERG